MIEFPPYRLDVAEQQLWKGDKLLALRRKPFAILCHLASNPKRLVTFDELLASVWAGVVVSESSVRTHLHELRQVLGDGVIETVVGRGYRFIADVSTRETIPARPARVPTTAQVVVGRDAELARMRAALDRASTGHRQVCFVSGDPGIGKTTLVDAFLDEVEDRGVLAVRGHCVEQFGTPEPYLAMIEAIGKLRRSDRGDRVLATFARYAPTFLAQMPHLVPDELLAGIQARAHGGTEARMMRELAEAIEVVCDQEPVVIVLEDLHWSDLATIDLLSLLTQRNERAKLLVIGTLRRVALQSAEHPLSRVVKTSVARLGASAIALEQIDAAGVTELMARRFPDHAFPPKLIEVLATITRGTPLFLVTLIDDLTNRGMLARDATGWKLTVSIEDVAAHRPATIKQLIDMQLDRLSDDEQRMLEAASLVGAVFETDRVAAALGVPVAHVEDRCDELVRRGLFLGRESSVDSPEGSVARYAVTHALVQEVCEQRGSPVRQQRWHLAIADHIERVYAKTPHEVALALALHCEKAGVAARAIEHYLVAGHQAAVRFASGDAVALFERARSLLPKLPRTPERDARELSLLATIGQLMIRTPLSGGDPLHVYERALELAREIGDAENEYAALANLCLRRTIHTEIPLALELGEELVAAEARGSLDPVLVEYGIGTRGFLALYRGDVVLALKLFDSLIDDSRRRGATSKVIQPTTMLGPIARTGVSRVYSALAHVYLGAVDLAVRLAEQAIAEVRDLEDPIAQGITESTCARIHFMRRDVKATEAAARVVLQRATAGWVLTDDCRQFAIWAEAHRAPLTASAAAGLVDAARARIARNSMGSPTGASATAAALWISGYQSEARALVELALANHYGERMCLGELLLLRGDFAVDRAAAIAAYREAWTAACELQHWLIAVRAAVGLADRALVAEALSHCPEGQNTPDFVAARAV